MKNKKVYVTKPWQITVKEEPFDEKILNDHEIIIENLYSHISAGTEMACVSGIESWFPLPNTPGYTSIGKVLEKGSEVDDVEVGDMVYNFGPHAKYFKVDRRDRWHGVCVKVPEGLSPEKASFTHMAGIAITSIRASDIEIGDTVVVSGQGTIGIFAAQFAQLQGATVIATDLNKNRLKVAQKCGIKNTIAVNEQSLPEAITKLTGSDKVQCWIDATGQPAVVEDAFNHIAINGEFILLGSPRADYETNLTPTLQKLHLIEAIKVRSALEFTFPTQQNDFNKHSIERNSRIIMDLMKSGKLAVEPLHSQTIAPEKASEAYFGLRDNPDAYIGVVIDWTK